MVILSDLFLKQQPTIKQKGICFNIKHRSLLSRFLKEPKYVKAINQDEFPVDHKLFLLGHAGCKKTTTVKAIVQELGKKIRILNLGGIVSSLVSKTAKNITHVFKKACHENAVLFRDEFDYIRKIRYYNSKDSGEMKRLVNTVVQLIDQLLNDTLLIAATNHSSSIDTDLLSKVIELKEITTK